MHRLRNRLRRRAFNCRKFTEHYGYHIRRTAGTRDWLLTFTISGEGCYVLGDCTHVCHRGSIVLLSPGTPHDYSAPKGRKRWGFFWAHFTPRADWVDWLKWSRDKGLNEMTITDAGNDRLSQAFGRLVQDNRNIGICTMNWPTTRWPKF